MLYMVEMDLDTPTLRDEWEAWYDAHIAKLMSIPGFRSAQRFRSTVPDDRSYLAIYTLASGDVLTSEVYKNRAGPKSLDAWLPHVSNWYRNLYSGLDEMPDLPVGTTLLVKDGTEPIQMDEDGLSSAGVEQLGNLKCVGLDSSAPFRRIGIVPIGATAPVSGQGAASRTYEAISERKIPQSVSVRQGFWDN